MGCCETYVGRAGDGLARENLTVARRDARPVRRLPDVESYDDFRPSRWCHGGILQSVGRLEALPATPTLPGRGARAQQFLSVVRSGERLRWQRPPALFGAGADGHSEAPDRRPLGACPYRRQCAECSPPKFIGGLSQTVMGCCIVSGTATMYPMRVQVDPLELEKRPMSFDRDLARAWRVE